MGKGVEGRFDYKTIKMNLSSAMMDTARKHVVEEF